MFSSILCLILVTVVHLSFGREPNDKAWTVKIMWKKDVVCAGTLLNNKFFLTLRDCINEKKLEDYAVIVGQDEVRSISYILQSPQGDDVITGRLSTKVMVSQSDIARIPRIASENQIVKARRNSMDNYVTGFSNKGEDQLIRVNVLPDNKCGNDFTRGVHFCFSKRSSSGSVCSVSLNAGSICTSHDDCGKHMKCEKNMCACTYCYMPVDGRCKVSDKKVLILGAGMAGISAAKTLGESGCSNILILEGSDRIGGRVKSVNISGYTVELGAQWIYGLGSNPMAALAKQYGLAMTEDFDTWVVRDKFGNDVTEKADKDWYYLTKVLKNVKKFARKMHKNRKPDITSEALLRKFGWNPEDHVAEAVEVYELDLESARETPSVSGKYLNHLRVFEEHDSDDWMIASDPRGYSFIIEEIRRSFRDGQRILFNKTVTSIENWHDEHSPVKVYTDDGLVYEADDVIVTFSLGVLQSRLVTFKPTLSEKKMMAIDKFGFGKYSLMYFKFSTAFWDNTSTIVYASERHGEQSIWYNMNTIYPGCNILQLALTGFEAEATEGLTDGEIIERALVVLRSMYPEANITEPESFVKSDWLSNPLTMGSYSYWTPAFRTEDMDYLGMPEGNLYFAGEHINQTNHGFVHSAYTSGMHTAMDLAGSVKLGNPLDKD